MPCAALRRARGVRHPGRLQQRHEQSDGDAEQLPRLHAVALRSGRPYSVLAIDGDALKDLNDRVGHAAGAAAPQRIAAALRSTVRQVDQCVRLGGDEFVVLLSETGLAGAVHAAERILAAVRAMRESDAQGTLTISIGAAAWREGREAHEVVQTADTLQYRAKQAGGARVVTR